MEQSILPPLFSFKEAMLKYFGTDSFALIYFEAYVLYKKGVIHEKENCLIWRKL